MMNRNPSVVRSAAIVAAILILIILYSHSTASPATYQPIKIPNKNTNPPKPAAEAGALDEPRNDAEEPLILNGLPSKLPQEFPDEEQHEGNLQYVSEVDPITAALHEALLQSQNVLTDAHLQTIFNSTVGFQKIFMIGLPARTDRLDVFSTQARLTGMDFTYVHGVSGADVSDKALPKGMNRDSNGTIGCWRAHLNVYQQMIQEGIHSALIFEDDADWDIGFKHQMLDFARGTRYVLDSWDPHTNSPYGDDWDVLWIGHNRIREPEKGQNVRRWVTPNDPTVVPPEARNEIEKADMFYWDDEHESDEQMYSRIVFKPIFGEGTIAYALSLRGAMKMLLHQSMLPFSDSVDTGMGKQCEHPELYSNFTCVAPYPKLVAESESAGMKGTDIPGHASKGELDWPESLSLMHSTRMNFGNLIVGNKTFEPQYKIGPQEVTMKDIAKIKGHAEILAYDNVTEVVVNEVVEDRRFTF